MYLFPRKDIRFDVSEQGAEENILT